MRVCREARRLISRRPAKSPLLKLPWPCLNSHNGESEEPLWKTSLTVCESASIQELVREVNASSRTFVEAVHVQLPHKGRDVGMFEVGSTSGQRTPTMPCRA